MSAFYNVDQPPFNMSSAARAIAAANKGLLFDPSDMSTMFQDAAGTIPVTAVEQLVGLILDKSQGLTLGPELVSNGTFDSDTGWTKNTGITISGGTCNFLAVAGGHGINQSISQSLSTDKKYLVEFEISAYSSGGGISVRIGNVGNFYAVTPSNGKKKLIISAGSASGFIQFLESAGSGTYSIDNISVHELYGNHATQLVTASRPTLSARYNLLTKTEYFSDWVWVKRNCTISSNVAQAPNGTISADKMVISSGTWEQAQVANFTAVGGSIPVIAKVTMKAGEKSIGYVQCNSSAGGSIASTCVMFNLSTGTKGSLITIAGAGLINPIAGITPLSNGFYECSLSFTTNATAGIVYVIPGFCDSMSSRSVVGDGVGGAYIFSADLRIGTDSGPYQRVNTATDYDTNPALFPKYLNFDGVDDYLNLPFMNLYGGGAASIIAARDAVSQATDTYIISERSTTNANPKYFPSRQLAGGGNVDSYISDDTAAAVLDTTGSAFSGASDKVIRSVVDTGNNIKLFKNGALAANDNYTRSGTLTLNNTTIGVSVSTTTGNYASMKLYGLIITKSALTDAQRVRCERFLERKAGVAL